MLVEFEDVLLKKERYAGIGKSANIKNIEPIIINGIVKTIASLRADKCFSLAILLALGITLVCKTLINLFIITPHYSIDSPLVFITFLYQ